MTTLIFPINIKPKKQLNFLRLGHLLPLALALMISASFPQIAFSADSRQAAVAEAIAENGTGGKVLGVREKIAGDGKSYFEVKILNKGKVVIYKIDKN